MSKRKKHSVVKRYERQAMAVLRDFKLCTAFCTANGSSIVDYKRMCVVKPTTTLCNMFEDVAYEWGVTIAAICRDESGEEYIKSEHHKFTDRVRQAEVVEYLNEKHQKLLQSCNSKHMVGAGWVANPLGDELGEQLCTKIFSLLGAWSDLRAELVDKAEEAA